jgi:hypothetical protein
MFFFFNFCERYVVILLISKIYCEYVPSTAITISFILSYCVLKGIVRDITSLRVAIRSVSS